MPRRPNAPRIGIGYDLCRARRSAGLTQRGLAEAIGVHRGSVACWEADIQVPSDDVLQRVRRVTGVWLGAFASSARESLAAHFAQQEARA